MISIPIPSFVRRLWSIPFLRFLIVGAVNTLFGYSVFAVSILAGLNYVLAAFVSTVLGILFNFKTTGVIVFKSHDNGLVLRFFAVYGVTYVISVFVLKVFKTMGVNVLVTAAFATLPMAFLSFVLMKRFVFYERKGLAAKKREGEEET